MQERRDSFLRSASRSAAKVELLEKPDFSDS